MGHTRDTKAWQELFGQFIEMDDHDWNAADDRLAKGCPPEKAEEISEDFVSFTRFVWSNFIDLKLDFDDHVIETDINRGPRGRSIHSLISWRGMLKRSISERIRSRRREAPKRHGRQFEYPSWIE